MRQIPGSQRRRAVALSAARTNHLARWRLGASVLLTALLALAWAAAAQARSAPDTFADLVEKLLPTVVNIQTSQTIEGGQAEQFEEFFKEFF